MRTRPLPLLCALALLLWLGACTPQAPAPSQATETPPATPEPAAKYDFKVLPVTEEGIRTLYGWEGYEVRRITRSRRIIWWSTPTPTTGRGRLRC